MTTKPEYVAYVTEFHMEGQNIVSLGQRHTVRDSRLAGIVKKLNEEYPQDHDFEWETGFETRIGYAPGLGGDGLPDHVRPFLGRFKGQRHHIPAVFSQTERKWIAGTTIKNSVFAEASIVRVK